jgi:hypothetical protein
MLTERGNNMLYNFEVVDYECDFQRFTFRIGGGIV